MTYELFDEHKIYSLLNANTRETLSSFEVLASIDSTNQYLLDKAKLNFPSGSVCLTEEQIGGRGRQGKQWVSTRNANIACSILWHFPLSPMQLSGLSLSIGVAIVRALNAYGITEGIGLKWPNDIYWNYKKLAGILIEIAEYKENICKLVIGVGINLDLTSTPQKIDQAYIDIKNITNQIPQRNRLTALLINEIFEILIHFGPQNFMTHKTEWLKHDIAIGKNVRILLATESIQGIVHDINHNGELVLLDEYGNLKKFASGEVSLRLD